MFYYYDPTYLLLIPGLLLALYAQFKVNSTFNHYKRVPSRIHMTGAEIARAILDSNNCRDGRVEYVHGSLTDHYDPENGVLRLSSEVYGSYSIAALGVAAQTVVPQLHVAIRTHGHVDNFAVTGDVHGDLAVERAGELRQELHQLPGEEIAVLHLIVIQARQRVNDSVTDARQIAMNFLLHVDSFLWVRLASLAGADHRHRASLPGQQA